MTVQEMAEALQLTVFSGDEELHREVRGAYVSDLLSDVAGHAEVGSVWITLHTHLTVVAVAALRKLSAVIVVNGYEPNAEVLEASRREHIPILSTSQSTFEVAGRLYTLLQQK
ncbi:MAG: serine kinase [Bacteroidales bacterium]|nr:serine kinase [Bacteroidales bacterium]